MFSKICFFTDEALFHLSGHINSQNSRIWNAENPRALHENTLYSPKEAFSAKWLEKELRDNCSINRLWEAGGRGENLFSILCNYTLFTKYLVSEIIKINQMVHGIALRCMRYTLHKPIHCYH
jgi:hypothetical protein